MNFHDGQRDRYREIFGNWDSQPIGMETTNGRSLSMIFIYFPIFSSRAWPIRCLPTSRICALPVCKQCHIHHLPHSPLQVMAGNNDSPQARIVEGDSCCRRAVQLVECHAIAPDGRSAFDDHEGAARDFGAGAGAARRE